MFIFSGIFFDALMWLIKRLTERKYVSREISMDEINNQKKIFIVETEEIINPIIIMSRKNIALGTDEPLSARQYH
ncbi:hypothetical protein EFS38_04390 [Dickeya undicola]|uniref:Uncharacterized protein n=1 Tax=Dickeya undicola TaxID=1577887 RepID=A0A3N0GAQ1_9GAMM|nr:hypothetical protein EF878_02310 [Dickeya undicola]RNM26976.1 hypothetical protein EFS38_04390 [Dickeya undicola]